MNEHDPASPTNPGTTEPSPWAGPSASGADHPILVTPVPVRPAPVVFRPEPKRRGGPSAFALVFSLAALLCVGGVAFAAGRLSAPAAVASNGTGFQGAGNGRFPNASPGASFQPGGGGFGGGFGAGGVSVEGTVTAVAADGTITLKIANGGTLEVKTDGQTTYHNESGGSASDVATGKTVRVQLSRSALGGGGFGGGAGGPAASGQPVAQAATDILVVAP